MGPFFYLSDVLIRLIFLPISEKLPFIICILSAFVRTGRELGMEYLVENWLVVVFLSYKSISVFGFPYACNIIERNQDVVEEEEEEEEVLGH